MGMQRKISIYQVLPRLFDKHEEHRLPGGDFRSNGCGKFNNFTPAALREIKKLGITHIWYTGILEHATLAQFRDAKADPRAFVKGEAGSPYAIKDYYDVSPTLAVKVGRRMEEWEALVQRTHNEGLGVIIDFVPNHIARLYHSDQASEEAADFGTADDTNVAFAPNNNFYYLPNSSLHLAWEESSTYVESPAKATGNDCFVATPSRSDWYDTVKLNYGVDVDGTRECFFDPIPDTWTKMEAILRYWADKGVDGFRCDMAEMVPVAFWRWVIIRLRAIYPNLLFIAEIYQPYLYGEYLDAGFNYLYDKVGLYDLLIDISRGARPASHLTTLHQSQEHVKGRMLRFMENHDEMRLASRHLLGSASKAKAAMAVAALLGTDGIMTYFGQELGEEALYEEGAFSGDDGRTSIFDFTTVPSLAAWVNNGKFDAGSLSEEKLSLRTWYQHLLNTALSSPSCCCGLFFDLMYINPQVRHDSDYLFLRSDGVDCVLVAANFSGEDRRCPVHIPQHAFDVLGLTPGVPQIVQEIFTGARGIASLSPDIPFEVIVPSWGAAVYIFSR